MSIDRNKITNIRNKKIAILGLGIENLAMLRYLLRQNIDSEFIICDARSEEQLGERYFEFKDKGNISWKLGLEFNHGLEKFDIMYRSPGWPIFCPGVQEALAVGIKLESPMRLFFDICPTKNIIGVTGTKGKGTTSSLIYEILKKDGRDVFIGGNIGEAPFSFIEKINSDFWVVLELSSFQLEDMETSPRIAVLTNFYKDHLASADPNNPNYHESMEAYWEAKENIFKWQNDEGILIAGRRLKSKITKPAIFFEKSDLKSRLVGEHNKENIGAAVEVAKLLKIDEKVILRAVRNFKGLPYRTEFIKEVGQVKYFNDSFATTPDSTIIGLKSFESPIVLLAGGADKGSDFSLLASEINKRVKYLVLFRGPGSDKISKELSEVKFDTNKIVEVGSMQEAFEKIKNQTKQGDIVLLSTACASFGVFNNYKERGRLFNEEVSKL